MNLRYLILLTLTLIQFHCTNAQKTRSDKSEKLSQNKEIKVRSTVVNKKGQLIQVNRLNWKGELIEDAFGIAVIKYEYNKNGKVIKISNLDKNNVLIKVRPYQNDYHYPEHPSFVKYEYNNLGNLTKKNFCNYDGKLIDVGSMFSHYAIIEYKTDDKGRIIRKEFFDSKGNPSLQGEMRVQYIEYKYDLEGLLSEKNTFYTGYDSQIPNHKMTHQYFYNKERQLIKSQYKFEEKDLEFIDSLLYRYNKKNNLIQMIDYEKGNLKETTTFIYNKSGNVIEKIKQNLNQPPKTKEELNLIMPDEYGNDKKQEVIVSLLGWETPNIKFPKDLPYSRFNVALDIIVDETGELIMVKCPNDIKDRYDQDVLFGCYEVLNGIKFKPNKDNKKPVKTQGKIKFTFVYLPKFNRDYSTD